MSDADAGIELDSPTGRTVLATVVLGSAVASLTATVVNAALPTLASDLDAGRRDRSGSSTATRSRWPPSS